MTSLAVPDAPAPESPAAPAPRPLARWWRLAAALAAGLLLTVAFPPYDVAVLAPVGIALLVLALRGSAPKPAALVGLVAGLGFFLPLLTWSGTVAGRDLWLLLAVFQAAYFVPMALAMRLVLRLPGWPVWIAGVWVAQEALRARAPFGGFPWGKLAFSQADTPFLAYASFGGTPLVSFVVALVGALLLAVATSRSLRSAPALAAVVAIAALVGIGWAGPVGVTPDGTATVALVQGNVPRLGLGAFEQREAVLGNHLEATHELAAAVRAGELAAPDLVLWPENASDIDPFADPAAGRRIQRAVDDVGVPVLVGAVLDGPGTGSYNSGIVWTPDGGAGERYVKRHPVPFGEYVPFRSLIEKFVDRVELAGEFLPGDTVGALDLGGVRIGDVICFEVAYDGLVRDTVDAGARLLVVQTNNASFERSGETWQQLAKSRLRAVEHGRAVAVVATSGVSAVIRPDGSVEERSDIFTRDLLVATVPLASERTPAARLGVAPEVLLVLVGLVPLAVVWWRRRAADISDSPESAESPQETT